MTTTQDQCTHNEWVYPERTLGLSGDETDVEALPYERGTYEDIGIGRYRCTQCGSVGYYTGLWRAYYESGTPCFGSAGVPRNLPPFKGVVQAQFKVKIEEVYAFEWSDCIYESGWHVVSLHATKRGAVKAMIAEANRRWQREATATQYSKRKRGSKCLLYEAWRVRPMEVLP